MYNLPLKIFSFSLQVWKDVCFYPSSPGNFECKWDILWEINTVCLWKSKGWRFFKSTVQRSGILPIWQGRDKLTMRVGQAIDVCDVRILEMEQLFHSRTTRRRRRRPAWRCVILRRSINGFLDKHLQMHEKAFGSWFTTFSWKRFFFKVRSIRSKYPCFLLNLNFHAKDNIYTSCTTFTNFSNIWIFVPNMLIFLSAEIFAFCDLWPQLKKVERSFLHSLIF